MCAEGGSGSLSRFVILLLAVFGARSNDHAGLVTAAPVPAGAPGSIILFFVAHCPPAPTSRTNSSAAATAAAGARSRKINDLPGGDVTVTDNVEPRMHFVSTRHLQLMADDVTPGLASDTWSCDTCSSLFSASLASNGSKHQTVK